MGPDTDAARQFRIDLGYDGTEFFGSQRQPGVRTVQGALEEALSRLSNRPARVTMAGRTDRGVHAVGQVAGVRLNWRGSTEALARALHATTPDDVVIYDAREVHERFHARFDARSREYRYRIWRGPRPPVLLRRAVWPVANALDVGAIRQGAETLRGQHDFASFAGAGLGTPESGVNTTRTIFDIAVAEWPERFEPGDDDGGIIELRIVANGFLPHMVRNIVGTLVEVGRGTSPPARVSELLGARDRRKAGPPAPARGLVLWNVDYGEGTGER